ncbi:MAG: hypothetical protein AAB526_01985 [Patescibacteria group bacterium]
MSEKKKEFILWVSVSIIAVIILIFWGVFLRQHFLSLKLQPAKKISPENAQIKENLTELKKSLESVQQKISEIKTIEQKETIPSELSPEQTKKIKEEIQKAIKQKQ